MSKQSVTDTLEPTVSLHVEVCRVRASTSPLSFTYDANERLSRIRAPGLDTAYDYFENGLTKSITTTKAGSTDPVASFTYDYDKGDMPSSQTSYIESNPAATQTTYAYDKAARLTGASSDLEALSYSYDASGNMASKTQGAQTTTYSYNSANQLQADSEENSYTYDPTGNLTSITGGTRPATSYTYDSEGRMTGAAVGQAQASYSYDPLGRMAMRTQGSASELFISRGTGYDPLSITGSSGMTSYLSSPDGSAKLASVSGEGTFNTLGTDIHGDVVFSADATGAITGSSLYSPYGVKSLSSGSQGALGFQGQYTDSLTGLVGMGLRNYDPTLGRFQTPDPKAPETVDPMSYDTYAYANDAPVARVDLMGTSVFSWINDHIVKPIEHAVVKACEWVYDNVLQPIGHAIAAGVTAVVRTVSEVAQEAYHAAVNSVRAVARTTRSIGAKIGRAMVHAAKTVGRAVARGAQAVGHAVAVGAKSAWNFAKKTGNMLASVTSMEAIGAAFSRIVKSGWEWACRNKGLILATIGAVVGALSLGVGLGVFAIEIGALSFSSASLGIISAAFSVTGTFVAEQQITDKWADYKLSDADKYVYTAKNRVIGYASAIPFVGLLFYPGQAFLQYAVDNRHIEADDPSQY
jgi:RHS repeat-associated protein